MNDEAVMCVYSKVRRMATRLTRTLEDAEDLCHDVVTQMLVAKLPEDLHNGWVFTAVRNRSISNYRKQNRERMRFEYQVEEMKSACCEAVAGRYETALSAVNDVSDRAQYSLLIAKLKTLLSEAQLRTLVLVACGASYKDIASMTGVSIGTVRSRVHYARRKAKEALEQGSSPYATRAL